MDYGRISITHSETVPAFPEHPEQRSNFTLNPFGKKNVPDVNNNMHEPNNAGANWYMTSFLLFLSSSCLFCLH
jgi:hypothetical protein